MTINDLYKFQIPNNPDLSDSIDHLIDVHNDSITRFANGITLQAIAKILVQKGIVTNNELEEELNACLNNHIDEFNNIIENYNAIQDYLKDIPSKPGDVST
jgi:ABC-type transporter Mla subunit MlaD